MVNTEYDVLIVGGGLVGASMALALAPLMTNNTAKDVTQPLRIAIIEAMRFNVPKTSVDVHQTSKPATPAAYDDRSIALAYGSRLIYQGMAVWSSLEKYAAAIQHIHVSDRGFFGAARLHASQENVPDLGYVVQSRSLGQTLLKRLAKTDVEWLQAKVTDVKQTSDYVQLSLDNDTRIRGRLVIAADGTQSSIRDLVSIGTEQRDYAQTAVIANVSTDQAANAWAYERFTQHGPIALLPMIAPMTTSTDDKTQRWSLVWTHPPENIAALKGLSDQAFLNRLQQAFGYRAGRFVRVGRRAYYPLSLVRAQQDVQGRVVVIGNASHTLHPVAGQGLNLALRDVAILAELIAHYHTTQPVDWLQQKATSHLLDDYISQRYRDYRRVIHYTDGLVRGFSNDMMGLGHLRALGLISVDRVPLLRRLLAEQSMGLKHRQARLSRGLALLPAVPRSRAMNVARNNRMNP
ncbi:MAG: 2-octaprenyl-6-methoxyphenyl hydroxylase [bacterium]